MVAEIVIFIVREVVIAEGAVGEDVVVGVGRIRRASSCVPCTVGDGVHGEFHRCCYHCWPMG